MNSKADTLELESTRILHITYTLKQKLPTAIKSCTGNYLVCLLTPIAERHDADLGSNSWLASTSFFTTLRTGFWSAEPSHFSRNPEICWWIQCWIRSFELLTAPPSGLPKAFTSLGVTLLPPSVDVMPANGGFPSTLPRAVGGVAWLGPGLDSCSSLLFRKFLRKWRFPFRKMSDSLLYRSGNR